MALNKGYSFVNAVQMHKLHPDTFEIPTEEVRFNLQPGDHVKLIFKPRWKDGVTERMWVRVFRRLNDKGVYEGALANEPMYDLKRVIQFEDVVFFRPDHVADIEVKT